VPKEVEEQMISALTAIIQREKDSSMRNNWRVFGTIAATLLAVSGVFATFFMPTIREETRQIVEQRVQKVEEDKVDYAVFRTVIDRLDRMERKIDELKR